MKTPGLRLALVACLILTLAGPLWGESHDSDSELADALRELAALIVDEMYEADLAAQTAALADLRAHIAALRAENEELREAMAAARVAQVEAEVVLAVCHAELDALHADVIASCSCP